MFNKRQPPQTIFIFSSIQTNKHLSDIRHGKIGPGKDILLVNREKVAEMKDKVKIA